jgi:uncharacterized repeat protein (TIGR01451 family)
MDASSWRKGRWPAAMVLLATALITGAGAASGPNVEVRLSGSIQDRSQAGAAWTTLKEGSPVAPGERIRYQVDLSNHGDREARTPTAIGPIPAGTALVSDTVTSGAGVKVEYSVDAGKTFSLQPTITVSGKDGRPRTIVAPVERYTAIRWTWAAPLAASAATSVAYQVQVR